MTGPKYDLDPYGTQAPQQGGYDADPYGVSKAAEAPTYAEDPYADPENMSDLERTVLGLPPKKDPSSRDIAARTSQNRAANVEALQALHDSPKTTAAQKERLKKLIDTMHDPTFYNTVTEDRFFGSNFLRGVATGVVSEGLLGTTDFLASVAELGLEGADALFDTKASDAVEAFRSQIAEAQQATEDTFDAQGYSGTAGRVTGALASQLVGGASKTAVTGVKTAFGGGAYGAVAARTAEELAKLPGFLGTAARLGQKGNFVQRTLINVVAGAPIDLLQAYTLPEPEAVKLAQAKQEQGIQLTTEEENAIDEHTEQQLKVLALGLTASGLGGALIEGGVKALGGTAQKIKAGAAPKPGAPNEAELTQQADAMILLANVAKKRNTARKAGSAAWNAGNIEMRRKLLTGLTDDDYALEFSKLPPDIKQSLLEAFGGPKIGPLGSDSQMNTSPAPAAAGQPATTQGASSQPTPAQAPLQAALTPAPTPAAVEPLGPLPSESAGTVAMLEQAQELVGRKGLTAEVAKVLKKRKNPPSDTQAMAAIVEAVARKIVDRHAARGITTADLKTAGGEKAAVEATEQAGKAVVETAVAPEERPVSVVDKTLTDIELRLKAASERESELERRLVDAERQASTDDLTGFQNKNAWGRARERIDADENVEIVSLDVGHLKATNDNVSYDAGDELLRRAAVAIKSAVGEADNAQFFRSTGDEFTVVVPKGRGHAVGEAATQAFGISPVAEVGVNNFLRYGVGATAAEADAAVRAAKKSSTQVRYDRATQSTVRTIEQPVKPADASDLEIEKLRKQQITASPTEAFRLEKRIRELRKAAASSAQPEVGPDTKVDAGPPAAPHRTAEAVISKPVEPQGPKRTLDQIDDDIGAVEDQLDAGEITQAVATARLSALGREKLAVKKGVAKEGAPPPLDVKMPGTVGKDLSKYEPEQLVFVKRNIRSLLNSVDRGTPEEAALQTEFKRIMDYEAKRDGGHGINLQMHPTITGGVGGFFLGYAIPADNEDERLRHAVYLGAVGLGGGIYAGKRWGPGVPRGRPKLNAWESEVAKKVYSHDDIKKPPVPFMMRLRKWYTSMVSRSDPLVTATTALGGQNLPVQRNPGKLMQVFGRWQAQTESFLIDGPSLVDKDGNVQWLNAKPVQKIFEGVNGDSDKLGLLMAAARALELGAKGVATGIDALAARLTFIKAAPEYHTAMTEMRAYNSALVDVADDAGLVADRAKMSDVFYAPLNRIFGGSVGASPTTQTITAKVKSALGVPNPIKGLKGGQQVILNPAEATVGNTPRILKAAEMNKMATALADLIDAAPDRALAGRIGKFLHGNERKSIPGFAQKIAHLQQEMAALGTSITQGEAEKLIHTMSNEALGLQDDVLRFWRNGKIEQMRLNPEVAKAFRSLNAEEIGQLWRFLGLPTQFARIGIVNNPMFVARQAWRDNWQAWLNSEYGFIPFVTQAQGWFHAVTRSPAYKEYLAAGGGYGSFAEQRFAKGQTALPDVQRAPVKNALDQTVKEIKEVKLVSAYQTFITPIVEAARVGEYLRARGKGVSTLEAVYAAKHVTANYQDIGTGMRALGHMTLFLNPSIKSLEQSARSFGRDPIAYLTKAFVGIALPSYYFWHSYQQDPELNDLRQTETGRRYWWLRTPAGIVKIPKPIFDGQIFGSSVETVLDKDKLKDPESAELTRKSIVNDVWVNLLPTLGVVPYSLLTNTDLGTGLPIIPDRAEGIDAQYQSTPTTSHLSRIVGEKVGVAPAQIDYAIRNTFGQLGINAVRLISNAVEYQETGYVPPKEEWPFMEELFARYPSLNVGSVREFYRHAEKVDEVARTISHAAKHDAENLEPYISANPADAGLIKLYKDTREKLAELRGAAEDIRLAPPETMSPGDKKLYIDQMFRSMILVSKAANEAAREVRRSYEGIQK